jgi:hypothetical protein
LKNKTQGAYAVAVQTPGVTTMTLCPIAVVAGCAKCPAVSFCPLKSVIGDAPKTPPAKPDAPKKK